MSYTFDWSTDKDPICPRYSASSFIHISNLFINGVNINKIE